MVEKACLFVQNSADDWCLEKTQLSLCKPAGLKLKVLQILDLLDLLPPPKSFSGINNDNDGAILTSSYSATLGNIL